MIIKKAVDDLQIRFQSISSDAKISRSLILHWIELALDQVLENALDDEEEEINGNILSRYDCQPIVINKSECSDCDYSMTLALPVKPKTLKEDKGIYQILRPGGKEVTRGGNAGHSSLVSRTQFANSSYWYRIDQTIYLVGKFPPSMKFTIIMVSADLSNLSEEDELPVPKSNLELLNEAEKIGRRVLATKADLLTDGLDEKMG